MSKQAKIAALKGVITCVHKPITIMEIFVQETLASEQTYYSKVPWTNPVEIICASEAGAKMLEEFLSTDIDRLHFDNRRKLYELLEKGEIDL